MPSYANVNWDADWTKAAWEGYQAALATQQAAREQQEPVGWLAGSGSEVAEDMFYRLESAQAECERHNNYEQARPDFDPENLRKPEPVYAAPVAQQSEAGADEYDDCPKCKGSRVLGEVRGIRCSTCDGTGMVHRADGEYMGECPCGGEAGAPTAAAELGIGFSNNDQGVHASVMRKHADGTFKVLLHDRVPTGDSFFRFSLDAPTSGRESAAPAAPVREGDREQDAKRIDNLRTALQQISETRFGYDGDCGTARIADDALYADEQAAAMQKGAQQ